MLRSCGTGGGRKSSYSEKMSLVEETPRATPDAEFVAACDMLEPFQYKKRDLPKFSESPHPLPGFTRTLPHLSTICPPVEPPNDDTMMSHTSGASRISLLGGLFSRIGITGLLIVSFVTVFLNTIQIL